MGKDIRWGTGTYGQCEAEVDPDPDSDSDLDETNPQRSMFGVRRFPYGVVSGGKGVTACVTGQVAR